jgi:hypothetical protein
MELKMELILIAVANVMQDMTETIVKQLKIALLLR